MMNSWLTLCRGRPCNQKQEDGFPLFGGKPAQFKAPSNPQGLDRSAPRQNTSRSDISICRGFSVAVMRFRLALVWTSRPCSQFRQSYDGVML